MSSADDLRQWLARLLLLYSGLLNAQARLGLRFLLLYSWYQRLLVEGSINFVCVQHSESDDFGFNAVKDKMHVRDLHATLLHQLGFDHEKFTYRFQGLDARLTGVEKARVVHDIVA